MSFQSEIRVMQVHFFSMIFGNQPDTKCPRLLALTASMPTAYLPLLLTLLTINSFFANALIRGTPEDFLQHKIVMQTFIITNTGQYIAKGLKYVAKFFVGSSIKECCYFLQLSLAISSLL
jgi:hypothetical protein